VPVTNRQAADQTVANEIFQMSLNDTLFEYTMTAYVKDGVITLHGPLPYDGQQRPDWTKRREIDHGILALNGANRVNDKLDVDSVLVVALGPVNQPLASH
jgi:hypothetical protein